MAFTPAVAASAIYRDYIVDAVPGSGKHRPLKAQIRTWGGEVEAYLSGHDTALAALDTRMDAEEAASAALDGRLDTAESDISALQVLPVIPSGVILMWSGSVGTIPSGWVICDGTSGTPDLRGRFVLGAGDAYSVGATGGQESITDVPEHTHANTFAVASDGAHTHSVTDPGHAHGYNDEGWGGGPSQVSSGSGTLYDTSQADTTDSATTGISIVSGGAHTHTLTGAITEFGEASVDIRPPYYALCYIMKT